MAFSIYFRILKNWLFTAAVVTVSILALVPLLWILVYVFEKGAPLVNWKFFVELPKAAGEAGGGISNALIGTIFLILCSGILSIPLGVAAGVYLSEFRESKMAGRVRLCVDVLNGIPSIVIGIVAYAWVVKLMKGFSLFSGAVALAIMMLPVVIKSSEETLKLIPDSLKEASAALGVPYHRIILKVILPSGLSGILTGILLATARISGETAPLLFTAFGNPFMSLNPLKPANALPLLIFNYATSPYEEWQKVAWGASVVLISLVLLLNLISRIGMKKWKVTF